MSADNWTVCPKCEGDLREDYEIGIYGKEFFIKYSGYCRDCGFHKQFRHEEQLVLNDTK